MKENWPENANPPEPGTSKALDRAALDKAWENVRNRMRDDLGETVWRCWIRNLVLINRDNNRIRLGAETRLVRNRVASQYADRLRANFKREWPEIECVDVEVVRAAETMTMARTGPDNPVRVSDSTARSVRPVGEDDPCGSRLDPRMTFDNFIVGKAGRNREALIFPRRS